ncbi:MAG TPA: APC family permease [Gaiellales bacterium]|nr:APC family permease [Gaiellales bacterium]
MAASEEFVEHTTAAAVAEKAKLVKHFSRFDIMFFLICTLVGVDTIGAVAADGPEAFFWLMALGLLFFFPYALLTAELGSAFTEEGGCYIWTKMAFGRFVACVNSVLYWLSNPVWVGGLLAIEAFQATNDFFFHMSSGSFWQYAFSILFIWFGIWAAILSFGIGKWIPTLGAFARIFLFAFFTITAILYGIKHGLHSPSFHNYKPTYSGFILLVPVLFFNYVGFELPNAAGDEMKDPQKDVPITIIRSMIASILLYGIPILAIILIVPAQQLSGVSGLSDALKIVYTVYGGSVHTAADGTVTATLTGFGKVMGDFAAACFILALLSSGTTWIMGSDRSQAVAGYDGAGPRSLGIFSARFGTPIVVNLLSGVVATITMIAAIQLAGGSNEKYFNAVFGVVLLFTTISYIAIFPTVIKLRYSHAHVHRPFKVPGGMVGVWVVGCITTFFAALATLAGLFPGLGVNSHLLDPAAVPTGFSRWGYEATVFIPILLTLAIGVLFYILGAPTRRQQVDMPLEGAAAPAVGD